MVAGGGQSSAGVGELLFASSPFSTLAPSLGCDSGGRSLFFCLGVVFPSLDAAQIRWSDGQPRWLVVRLVVPCFPAKLRRLRCGGSDVARTGSSF
ncbi:unnamed protein product [Arabidopsis halleri]